VASATKSRKRVLAIVETAAVAAAPPAPAPPPHLRRVPHPFAAPPAPRRSQQRTAMPAATASSFMQVPRSGGLARELGVTLGAVRGSGPNGRITRDDVQGFVKTTLASGVPAGNERRDRRQRLAAAAVAEGRLRKNSDRSKRVPLTRIPEASAEPRAQLVMIPARHAVRRSADVNRASKAFRVAVEHASKRTSRCTMLALMIKASVAALKKFPSVNSSLDGEELVLKQYYKHRLRRRHARTGSSSRSCHDADKKGVLDIARDLGDALEVRRATGKLGIADMYRRTVHDLEPRRHRRDYSPDHVNAPEVAMLGWRCRTAVKPVWDAPSSNRARILPALVFIRHRVIDGASAARFTTFPPGVLRVHAPLDSLAKPTFVSTRSRRVYGINQRRRRS